MTSSSRRRLDNLFYDVVSEGHLHQAIKLLKKGAQPNTPYYHVHDLLYSSITHLGHHHEMIDWLLKEFPYFFCSADALAILVKNGIYQGPIVEQLLTRLNYSQLNGHRHLEAALRRAYTQNPATIEDLWKCTLEQAPQISPCFMSHAAGSGNASLLRIALNVCANSPYIKQAKQQAFLNYCKWRYHIPNVTMLPEDLTHILIEACNPKQLRYGRVAAHQNKTLCQMIETHLNQHYKNKDYFPLNFRVHAKIVAEMLISYSFFYYREGFDNLIVNEIPMLNEAPFSVKVDACKRMIKKSKINYESRGVAARCIDYILSNLPMDIASILAKQAEDNALELPGWKAQLEKIEILKVTSLSSNNSKHSSTKKRL